MLCISQRPFTIGILAFILPMLPMTAAAQVFDAASLDYTANSDWDWNSPSQWCQQWSMESRISQAQLILVARVSNISAISVIRGAKVNTALREYRFQPVSVLKGVFTRDELAMTDSDLGLPAPDPAQAAPFKHGEHVLLILTRTLGNYGCVSLPRGFNNQYQLIPRLADGNDPIVSMTETLIQVSQSPSRQRRVELSIDKLRDTSGPAVVPLVLSLGARGYWVQKADAAKILADLTTDETPAVRSAAASTIGQVLAAGAPINDETRRALADALRKLLATEDVETNLRVAAIKGLGHLDEFGRRTGWVSKLLVEHLRNARTHVERIAALIALAELKDSSTKAAVLQELKRLPLDEKQRESTYIKTAVSLAGSEATPVLMDRLHEKLRAGHAAIHEISQLGELKHKQALPILLRAAHDGKHNDEAQLAAAFQKIGDDKAVPVLTEWLSSINQSIRWAALNALGSINSDAAVSAIRMRLKSEPNLQLKLQMAAILGRHGIEDGNAIALEHLADPGVTYYAAQALAAVDDERTPQRLWTNLETSNDTQWSGATLQGLAALNDPKVGAKLAEVLSDRRSPLLQSAITAANQLGDPSLMKAIAPYALSRNYQIATSSLTAIKQLAQKGLGDVKYRDDINQVGETLIEVLNDPDIHMKLRVSALDVLRTLKDNRLPQTLKTLADHSKLENTELMTRINQALATL